MLLVSVTVGDLHAAWTTSRLLGRQSASSIVPVAAQQASPLPGDRKVLSYKYSDDEEWLQSGPEAEVAEVGPEVEANCSDAPAPRVVGVAAAGADASELPA